MGGKSSPALLRVLVAFMSILQFSAAIRVKLYSGANAINANQQIFYENTFSSLQTCNSIEPWARNKATRFESDSCIIVHTEPNCRGNGLRLEAGVHSMPSSGYVNSLRTCTPSDAADGSNGRLALYAGPNRQTQVANFENMCGCIQLPDNLYNRVYSLNNYGGCVRLYDGNGCTAQSFQVSGHPSDACSNNLNNCGGVSWTSRLRSLEACTKPVSCLNIKVTVIGITVTTNPTQAELDGAAKTLPISTTKKFRNSGNEPARPEHSARKMMSTTNAVRIGNELLKLKQLRVSPTVAIHLPDWLLIAKSDVSSALIAAYRFDLRPPQKGREVFTQSTQNEFSVAQQIELRPCKEVKMNSYVKLLERYPVSYEVEVEISGTDGSKQIKASDLKTRVGKLEWVRDIDLNTIVMKEASTMTVSFGIETFVESKSQQMVGCVVGP